MNRPSTIPALELPLRSLLVVPTIQAEERLLHLLVGLPTMELEKERQVLQPLLPPPVQQLQTPQVLPPESLTPLRFPALLLR